MYTIDDAIREEEIKISRLNKFIDGINELTDEEIKEKGENNLQGFLTYFGELGFKVEYDILTEYILKNAEANVYDDVVIQNYDLRQGKDASVKFLNGKLTECETRIKIFKTNKGSK